MQTSHSTRNDTNTSLSELRVRHIQADHRYLLRRMLLLVGSDFHSGKDTIISSRSLLHPNPSRLDPPVHGSTSCCFATVPSSSTGRIGCPSYLGSLDCHLCNVKMTSSKISIACSFSSFVSSTVVPPLIKSST